MRVSFESPDQPDVLALIAELDAYQDTLYPPESLHLLDLNSLKQANVIFAVARDEDARAVGCGAVVLKGGYGEIKRMYVHPTQRGRGVAKKILSELETAAQARGYRELRLETGPYQPEALGFYTRNGYAPRASFGEYSNDPLSVFMQKKIGA